MEHSALQAQFFWCYQSCGCCAYIVALLKHNDAFQFLSKELVLLALPNKNKQPVFRTGWEIKVMKKQNKFSLKKKGLEDFWQIKGILRYNRAKKKKNAVMQAIHETFLLSLARCIRDRSWWLLWVLIRAAVTCQHVFHWKQMFDAGQSAPQRSATLAE